MIRVMLVDDELLGRMMVRSLIDWEREGYTICGECSDGSQAWSLIPALKPQIVITDVKMNHMNGDELVRRIEKEYPQICTIVLSGYDDYKYVREVLKHSAIDYLIKNDLTPELLLESLHKAEEIQKMGPKIEKDENNLQALRRQFVLRLIGGEYEGKDAQIEKEVRTLGICLDVGRVIPILLVMGNLDEKINGGTIRDRMLIHFSVCNVLEEIVREEHQGMAAALENNEILLLVSLRGMVSEGKQEEELRRILNRCSFCLDKFMRLEANFHVGRAVPLGKLQNGFQELEERRREEFLDLRTDGEQKRQYNNGNGICLEEEQRISAALRQQDKGMLEETLDGIFKEVYQGNILRKGCTQLFSDLIILAVSYCKKKGIAVEKVYNRQPGIMDYVAQLERLKDCRRFFGELFGRILEEQRDAEGEKGYSVPVRKAVSFIRRHYMEGISLSDAAEYAGVNSSYLSTLFKAEVGNGFVEYLNEVRLERAREDMDVPGIHLKEIMDRAGFCSYSNFFNLFKKKYGMTPREYQKEKGKE